MNTFEWLLEQEAWRASEKLPITADRFHQALRAVEIVMSIDAALRDPDAAPSDILDENSPIMDAIRTFMEIERE